MLLLAVNAAIFHEFTSGANLQFYFVYRCFAAAGAHLVG
jgi:hypothetical protein